MKYAVSGCPVELAMTLIGGRWRLVIVHFLLAGPRRFSALRRDIPGISQKMLTTDLRALEDAGMVHREIHAQVPVKVVYSLTDAGLKLDKLVEVVRELGLRMKEEEGVEQATEL